MCILHKLKPVEKPYESEKAVNVERRARDTRENSLKRRTINSFSLLSSHRTQFDLFSYINMYLVSGAKCKPWPVYPLIHVKTKPRGFIFSTYSPFNNYTTSIRKKLSINYCFISLRSKDFIDCREKGKTLSHICCSFSNETPQLVCFYPIFQGCDLCMFFLLYNEFFGFCGYYSRAVLLFINVIQI